jgi:hypothetical protein
MLQLQIDDDSSNTIARIDLRVNGTGTEIRFSGFDGNFRSTDPLGYVQSSPVTAAIDFDFDNNTIDYLLNGSVVHSFAFTGSNIGRLSYVLNGSWTTAASSVSIDHLKLIGFVPSGSLYDAFASAYPWNGILKRAPDDDPDRDGLTNFLEFAFGTAPDLANGSVPVIVDSLGGVPVIRFTPVRDTSVIDYEVEFSIDLADWTTIPPVTVATPAGVPVEEALPFPGQGFSRVRVSQ